jgi:hypothetical protein
MAKKEQETADAASVRELLEFPLLKAMFGRRARRFGLGMTIPDGPLAYESKAAPIPLNDLERTILILCGAGINGWNTSMEHTAAGAPDTGCNYPVRLLGRTFPSGAGIYASELTFTDDSGTFLTRFRDLDPTAVGRLEDTTPAKLIEFVKQHCVKLADGRVTVPVKAPHTSAHNLWNANKPGTTVFAPVIDLSEQMFDLLAVYMGMGFTPFDPHQNRICGNLEPWIGRGLIDGNKRFSIVDFDQYCLATGAMELALVCHNMTLALQAMGLGGWLFTGINPPSLMGAFEPDGIKGMGFRFSRGGKVAAPNPVGIDGQFEGLCPPYCTDMRAAAMKFNDRKFGPGGTFDPSRPGPFRDNASVKARVERYTPEFVDMLGEAAQYMYDTYGRFPATVPTFYMRAYTQAHHLETGFYDKFYGPGFYLDTHRTHMEKWHGGER